MEKTTLIGYISLISALVIGISYGEEGIDFSTLLNFVDGPSIFIVFGGTAFALLASFPFEAFKNIPKHIKMAFRKSDNDKDPYKYIEVITDLSKEARKKGLLALEGKVNSFEDKFLKESVLLIVDAIEPDKLKKWFEQKLTFIWKRNEEERNIYERGAAFAPAFGMIGTLIGLVNMLKSMDLDGPESLGADMSVALITTFYGTILANCFFIPICNKVQIAQENEMLLNEMIVEGVISIKEGENPRYIEEKLMNFLEEKDVSNKADGKVAKKKSIIQIPKKINKIPLK